MHLSLNDVNAILSQQASSTERETWMDHLLECDSCSTRFKAMNALHQAMTAPAAANKARQHTLRYAVGVAAVMFMAVYPVVTRKPTLADSVPPAQTASVTTTMATTLTEPPVQDFSVLTQVAQVNYRNALAQWGQSASLTELVEISNHKP